MLNLGQEFILPLSADEAKRFRLLRLLGTVSSPGSFCLVALLMGLRGLLGLLPSQWWGERERDLARKKDGVLLASTD